MVYFVLALALFSPAPYLEVMRHLIGGLRGQGLLGEWHIPAKSSLFRARQRLGSEPLRVLFATTAKPMGTEATPGCFWHGLRLLAVDGTCWDVADSVANEAAFGRPGNSRGHDKSSFPQVRMACLIEVGTHLVLDAELAGCRTGEVTLCLLDLPFSDHRSAPAADRRGGGVERAAGCLDRGQPHELVAVPQPGQRQRHIGGVKVARTGCPPRAPADDDRAEQRGQQPPVSVLDACAHHTVRAPRRVRAGSGGVLLPPGPQFQVVRQELPQDLAAPQVKEFFQLVVVQAGTRRAGEVGNERGEQMS